MLIPFRNKTDRTAVVLCNIQEMKIESGGIFKLVGGSWRSRNDC